jgi:hypothetical protein
MRSLNLAQERLRASSPDETTVTDVAFSLGILHLGRFARRYRTLFGEAPHETLNRPHPSSFSNPIPIAESG